MGNAKSEKVLREETRARRAKQDLKNTPLPLKRHGSPPNKKLFSSKQGGSNKLALNRLTSRRMATGIVHSKSMSDLRSDSLNIERDRPLVRCRSTSNMATTGDLLKYIGGGGRYKMTCQNLIDKYARNTPDTRGFSHASSTLNSLDLNPTMSRRFTKSCSDLSSLSGSSSMSNLTRSRSYHRLPSEKSSYEKNIDSYRSTIRNIYTNLSDFSARTVAALSSDKVKGLRYGSVSSSIGSEPSLGYSSYSSNSSATKLPQDLTTTHAMKSFRQMKLTNTFLEGSKSLTSSIGNTYKQYSNNFTSSRTTAASKSRFTNMKSVFSFWNDDF